MIKLRHELLSNPNTAPKKVSPLTLFSKNNRKIPFSPPKSQITPIQAAKSLSYLRQANREASAIHYLKALRGTQEWSSLMHHRPFLLEAKLLAKELQRIKKTRSTLKVSNPTSRYGAKL